MRLKVIGVRGKVFWLTSHELPRVQLNEGGLQLRPDPRVVATASALSGGQVPSALTLPPMTGSLALLLHAPDGGLVEMDREWRQAWDMRRECTLLLSGSRGARGEVSTRVRLDRVLDPPPGDLEDLGEYPMNLVVSADSGCWWVGPHHGTGLVTVSNTGDWPLTVRITWQGAGGQVTLPSGATFTLPPTSQERTLLLDDEESLAVVDEDGQVDTTLYPIPGVIAEPVPVGQTRVYQVPDGARVEWSIPVFDPWTVI